jgi:hypothetical protein
MLVDDDDDEVAEIRQLGERVFYWAVFMLYVQ